MTADEYKVVIENAYGRRFLPGKKWCLFGDYLVVAHPERAPITIAPDGEVLEIVPR